MVTANVTISSIKFVQIPQCVKHNRCQLQYPPTMALKIILAVDVCPFWLKWKQSGAK